MSHVSATILGLSSTALTPDEIAFFKDVQPAGFILFKRNIDTPSQVEALTQKLREIVARDHVAILIDQEGGRVARLGPPHWASLPPMGYFGDIALKDAELANRALSNNVRIIAHQLGMLGITVDCLPLLDVRQENADGIIGDRAFGYDARRVAEMGTIVCKVLREEGCLPIIKHIPGHGRATVDSHLDRPFLDTSLETLKSVDFVPFQALRHETLAMTAHICFAALDADELVTFSARSIAAIRNIIGFTGLIVSDDLSMGAISGDYVSRAEKAKQAGVDLMLHCNGKMSEMQKIVKGAGQLDDARYGVLHDELAALSLNKRSSIEDLLMEQSQLIRLCEELR